MKHRTIYRTAAGCTAALLAALAVTIAGHSTATAQPPNVVTVEQPVLPLPGQLDTVPMLDSNSPEVVQEEGILVSTATPEGKRSAVAHLNYPFNGRFDIFMHHIARSDNGDLKTLYLGVMLENPTPHPVTIKVLSAASYLSQPDAPFVALPACAEDPECRLFAGPGDRVTGEILRSKPQSLLPEKIVVPANSNALLISLPVPVKDLTPPLNGRSFLARLQSNGRVYAATLAAFGRQQEDGTERPPTVDEWRAIFKNGSLAGPRERTPSLPGASGPVVYGRVGGVAVGDKWTANLGRIDISKLPRSYPISTVEKGTLGTGQVQSATLVRREPGTAYAAHGNYGVEYSLSARLLNYSKATKTINVLLQTPLKNSDSGHSLKFYEQPAAAVFFRGAVRVSYTDDSGKQQVKYWHLVEHQGEQGTPLATLNIKQGENRPLQIDLIYPPDATPPQAVTLSVASSNSPASPAPVKTSP